MAEFNNWGDFFWPGQIDDCRRNLLGEHDAGRLERLERNLTANRAAQHLRGESSIAKTNDLNHLRALHHHLFQDVYAWAGQLRPTELVRPSNDPNTPGHEFVKPEDIERLAPRVFEQVGDIARLAYQPRDDQVDTLAKVYAGVNVLHPFIEGNGRTNRLLLQDIAATAGLHIDWKQMPHQNHVMAEAFTQGYQPVAAALSPCVTDAPGQRITQSRSAFNPGAAAGPTTTNQTTTPRHQIHTLHQSQETREGR